MVSRKRETYKIESRTYVRSGHGMQNHLKAVVMMKENVFVCRVGYKKGKVAAKNITIISLTG